MLIVENSPLLMSDVPKAGKTLVQPLQRGNPSPV